MTRHFKRIRAAGDVAIHVGIFAPGKGKIPKIPTKIPTPKVALQGSLSVPSGFSGYFPLPRVCARRDHTDPGFMFARARAYREKTGKKIPKIPRHHANALLMGICDVGIFSGYCRDIRPASGFSRERKEVSVA